MRWLLSCFVIGCAAAPPRPTAVPGAWPQLQRLAGTWTGTSEGGARVDITFKPIAKGTALAETFGPPGRETMTLYHPDGSGVVATHYCAQGNQPRLRATRIDGEQLVLDVADVTDLGRDESHLVQLELVFGNDAFDRVEVYRNGRRVKLIGR